MGRTRMPGRRWVMMMVALGGLAGCGGAATPSSVPLPAPPTARRHPAPPPPLAPERLVGLTREQTTALLGPPADQAGSGAGTIWTYRNGGCALSLLFYPEVESHTDRLMSYEARGRAGAADCLTHLHDAHVRRGE